MARIPGRISNKGSSRTSDIDDTGVHMILGARTVL